jgi:hemerythrin-like domain-containing protein
MNDLKRRLADDHAELERQLQALARSVDADDPACDLSQCWTEFEASLRVHLDTEERCIFPEVASAHRPEVEELRAEHRHIRNALTELGLAVELHTLRKASVDELLAFLSRHAARENSSLYDWLEQASSPGPRRGLLAMFERHQRATEQAGSAPRAAAS